jgi:2,5-furandicarboxylate decarboxylase 1
MGYADLRAFLADIGPDLLRVDERLSPRHEIAAVLAGAQSSGKAVLCSDVDGYPGIRVAGNLLGSRRLMARALGTTEDGLADTYLGARHRARPPVPVAGPAPVKEVVHEAPAEVAAILPILTHHEDDAAPYITCGVVLARDPATGRRAMGIHRMMVHGGNRLGILLANPPLSLYLAAAERTGRPLEVAVALGVDPAMLLAAVIKAGTDGPDKLEIAGGLRGHALEMTPGLTVDLDIPARAEAVIEGRVLPGVRRDEGPFGENTGYYFTNSSPVLEVSAIMHRRDFIYAGLCPWTTEVDNLLSLAAGADLLGQLRSHVHGVRDLELVAGTCGFNAVLAVDGLKPHEVRRLILLALGLDRRLKSITVVDSDIDIRDPRHVSWALATRYQPDRDTVILSGLEGYVIDPSPPPDGGGSKIGFDATKGGQAAGKRIAIPAAAMERAAGVLAGALARAGVA